MHAFCISTALLYIMMGYGSFALHRGVDGWLPLCSKVGMGDESLRGVLLPALPLAISYPWLLYHFKSIWFAILLCFCVCTWHVL